MESIERFKTAQETCYEEVLEEIKNGEKQTHWMWFIFPQIFGLGSSPTAEYYGIKTLNEAVEYLDDEVLGTRLIELCEILLSHENKTANEIFGSIDSMKLRSSMTLFNYVSENPIFKEVIDKYFNGELDELTINICNILNHNKMLKR